MTAFGTFEKLLEPFQIKHLQLKNRIVKPATWLVYPEDDGTPGDRVIAHLVPELYQVGADSESELTYVGGGIHNGARIGLTL